MVEAQKFNLWLIPYIIHKNLIVHVLLRNLLFCFRRIFHKFSNGAYFINVEFTKWHSFKVEIKINHSQNNRGLCAILSELKLFARFDTAKLFVKFRVTTNWHEARALFFISHPSILFKYYLFRCIRQFPS